LEADQINGLLVGYVIYYSQIVPVTTTTAHTNIDVPAAYISTMITGLNPWTFYQVQVSCQNTAGIGAFSPIVSTRTLAEGEL